jgi:hypothetical protein
MSVEEMVQGFLYLIDQTYRLDKVVSRLWSGWFGQRSPTRSSGNGLKNRKDQFLQRIGAFAFNLAYREVYMGQKDLFKEKMGIG